MGGKIGGYRWRIVGLLFFATTINYLDRQVIGILKPYISDSLGWTETSYGYIVSAFQAAYALGLLATGRLLDRFGTKIGYAVAIVVWSFAGMGHALARSAFSFGVARFGLGLGESANFPAAAKAIAEWFPRKERALATGLFNTGSNIGAIAAPLIVTFVTVKYGWPWAFVITGALGFLWVAWWISSYRLPRDQPKLSPEEFDLIHSDNEDPAAATIPWKKLILDRRVLAIFYARLASDWVWWFILFWTPAFLNKTHGIAMKGLALPLIVIYTVASFGAVAGGGISSILLKRGKSLDSARKTAMLVCALCIIPVALAPVVPGVWAVVGLISLAAACHQGWAASALTLPSDVFPKSAVASVAGLAGFGGAVGGAAAASIVGWILQLTGSYVPIFIAAASTYIVAWVVVKLLMPKIEPDEIRASGTGKA